MEEVNIANKIKDYRKAIDLTQEELAKKSQVSTRAIQNYERGERRPGIDTARRIAEALGQTVDEVFPAPK